MNYVASICPEIGLLEEGEIPWEKQPVRMLYLVTIEIQEPGELGQTRTYSFHVPNFHNAEAIQLAFKGISTIDVSIEPDVLGYLARSRRNSGVHR
jgi:hypothetical protein